MKKLFLKTSAIFLLGLTSIAFASDDKEKPYHCPSINDIKYDRGSFSAQTNYNGVTMNWYASQTFQEASVPINKFKFTYDGNDCVGGTCEIYCVYDVSSRSSSLLKFGVSYQDYRFLSPISGPWNGNYCESDSPEDCKFSAVKNKW